MTFPQYLAAERARIEQMARDEAWLAGERLHRPVRPDEPIVQQRVAEIILAGAGAQLRAELDPHGAAR